MNPEEKVLLDRTLKLSEENNKLLKKLDRRAKWAFAWGVIKIIIIVAPLILGFILLQPYLDQALQVYDQYKDILLK